MRPLGNLFGIIDRRIEAAERIAELLVDSGDYSDFRYSSEDRAMLTLASVSAAAQASVELDALRLAAELPKRGLPTDIDEILSLLPARRMELIEILHASDQR